MVRLAKRLTVANGILVRVAIHAVSICPDCWGNRKDRPPVPPSGQKEALIYKKKFRILIGLRSCNVPVGIGIAGADERR